MSPPAHRGSLISNGRRNTVRFAFTHPLEWISNVSTGDLIYMDVMGQAIVVINSLKIATDLLEKRSTIYSDRPDIAMPTL